MADFVLAEPIGWEYDLHSVYSAWIGHFQVQNIQWYERSWAHVMSSFGSFLEFEWPVMVVTDAYTGKGHIVTRLSSIEAFIKMVKTRFGEVLSVPPNLVRVTPFESTSRQVKRISDMASYKKSHASLQAASLLAFKTRVREGDPKAVEDVWKMRDKTFLALDFEWSERNEKSILEWGYAAVRCGYLEAQGYWPPDPDVNFRKGHFIIAEYADKMVNRHCPNHPWHYAFGDSQVVNKTHVSHILEAVFSSLASPDSDTSLNELVLLGHGISAELKRIEELKIKFPRNMLVVDLALYERRLFQARSRGSMIDPKTGKSRHHSSFLSLESLLRSLPVTYSPSPTAPPHHPQSNGHRMIRATSLPGCVMHNAGNDAFMALFAFQKLLDPDHTPLPSVRKSRTTLGTSGRSTSFPGLGIPPGPIVMPPPAFAMYGPQLTPPVVMAAPNMPLLSQSMYNLAGPGVAPLPRPLSTPISPLIVPMRTGTRLPGRGGLLTPDSPGLTNGFGGASPKEAMTMSLGRNTQRLSAMQLGDEPSMEQEMGMNVGGAGN